MTWNPFAKPKPTPLTDVLAKMTAAHIAKELAEPPEDHAVLGRVIAFRTMMAASHYLDGFREFRVKVPDLDLIAFETLAFTGYAIRDAYNPMPRLGHPDSDAQEDAYERLYDADVSGSFKLATAICTSLAERTTGWTDLIEVTNRRQMHYGMAKTEDEMFTRFLDVIRDCQTASSPMVRYDQALPLDQKTNEKLTIMSIGYATMMIPPQAREIDKVIEEYGFRAP